MHLPLLTLTLTLPLTLTLTLTLGARAVLAAHAAAGAPSGAEPLAAIFSREAEGAEARLAAAGTPVEAAVRVLGARPLRTVVPRPALLARAQPGGRIAQPVPGEGSGSGSG